MVVMCFRIGWVQIVKGDEYKRMAEMNHKSDSAIEAKRGTIYDRNKARLAVSAPCYSVWVRPDDIRQGETKADKEKTIEQAADVLAETLSEDRDRIFELITSDKTLVKIAKYKRKVTADKLRKQIKKYHLAGVEIEEDSRRYYPNGAFAAHVLGSVTDENKGRSGIELQYDSELKGIEGRSVKDVAADGKDLSYKDAEYYEASDGTGVMLTIDEVIQHYVEKAIASTQKKMKSKKVMCIVMDPSNGDVLAMATSPEFSPNDPLLTKNSKEVKKMSGMGDSEVVDYLNEKWRNPVVSDTYEPGSTFKLITLGATLEEQTATKSSTFNCSGATYVVDTKIKCWYHPNAHGTQTVTEATKNSCNPVFVQLALRLGTDKFYKYLENFGLTEKTGIDCPGETSSIVIDKKKVTPVDLACIGFGQSITVTPIQLITAISSYANDGKLMQPRLVKAYTDHDGNIVKEIPPKVKRRIVSPETAKEVLKIMDVSVNVAKTAASECNGYKVGGKTGTAEKTINQKISKQTYSSFIGVAPIDDPRISVLVVVDSPAGAIHGAEAAEPCATKIIENTLRYMDVKADGSK